MDHLKKYISIKFSNTPKYIIECYLCRKREIENTCKKCFIFKWNEHSLTNFRKQITHYTASQNNNVFPRIVWVCNESMSSLQIIS